jgi:AcrR family transcriptional regulator
VEAGTGRESARLTRKGRATRERIVAAAAGLMFERGVAGTSVDDVRSAAEVSSSQLYHYFGGKQELVRAVIAHQTDAVLAAQQPQLGRLDSIEGLRAWRDLVLALQAERDCAGGCPIGSLAAELAEIDPAARLDLADGLGRWAGAIREGLAAMRDRRELTADADPDRLAMATLAAQQGGQLLAQVHRDTTPLRAALDAAIAHIRSFEDTSHGTVRPDGPTG